MKKILFTAISLLLLYSVIEFFSFSGLKLLKKVSGTGYYPILTHSLTKDHLNTLQAIVKGTTTYLTHSPVLGWTIKPNGFWDNLYRANSKGIRGDREYQFIPKKNRVRISAFGDSFTHCDEVKNESTWQEQLSIHNAKLEVLNFGVGGYGLDQAFLRYKKEGVQYHSHIIFIGFIEENINRLVNVYRPFYYPGIPLTKPRFFVRENQLILFNNPLADLHDCNLLLSNPESLLDNFGRNDYFYKTQPKESIADISPTIRFLKLVYYSAYKRYLKYSGKSIYNENYYNEKSEAFGICKILFDEFYSLAQKNNSLPIIIIFATRSDLERYHKDKTKIYSPLLKYFMSKGYRYIDLADAFEQYSKSSRLDDLFTVFHYLPAGNSIVAKILLDYLNKNNFTDLTVIKKYIKGKTPDNKKKDIGGT
jgi:hypothetical protein